MIFVQYFAQSVYFEIRLHLFVVKWVSRSLNYVTKEFSSVASYINYSYY